VSKLTSKVVDPLLYAYQEQITIYYRVFQCNFPYLVILTPY